MTANHFFVVFMRVDVRVVQVKMETVCFYFEILYGGIKLKN